MFGAEQLFFWKQLPATAMIEPNKSDEPKQFFIVFHYLTPFTRCGQVPYLLSKFIRGARCWPKRFFWSVFVFSTWEKVITLSHHYNDKRERCYLCYHHLTFVHRNTGAPWLQTVTEAAWSPATSVACHIPFSSYFYFIFKFIGLLYPVLLSFSSLGLTQVYFSETFTWKVGLVMYFRSIFCYTWSRQQSVN